MIHIWSSLSCEVFLLLFFSELHVADVVFLLVFSLVHVAHVSISVWTLDDKSTSPLQGSSKRLALTKSQEKYFIPWQPKPWFFRNLRAFLKKKYVNLNIEKSFKQLDIKGSLKLFLNSTYEQKIEMV